MFGFGSNDYAPRSDYMRAIAEEQAARQQQARLRRQQQQQQQQYGRAPFAQPLFGGVDDDYGFEPPSFPGYGAPGGRDRSREARYRAALEEEARLERAERQRAQELFRLRQQEEARARAAAELERRQAYEAAMRERERELQRRRAAAEEAWKARAEMERQRRRQDEIRREEAQRQLRERLGLRTRPEQTARTARSTNAQVPYAQTVPYGARARTTSPSRSEADVAQPPLHAEAPSRAPSTQHTCKYTEEQTAAVETIQAAMRTRKIRANAFVALDGLSKSFRQLRAGFSPPPVLEFLVDGVATPVPTDNVPLPSLASPVTTTDGDAPEQPSTPKLAYTSASMPLHAYDEELARLLGRLDAVESGGDLRVRNRRRALVRQVEGEAVRMEQWRGLVWKAHIDSQQAPAAPSPQVTQEADGLEPSQPPVKESSPTVDTQTADDSDLSTPGPSVETLVHLHPSPAVSALRSNTPTPPTSDSDVTADTITTEDLTSTPLPPSTFTPTNDTEMQHPPPFDSQPAPGGIDSIAAELAAPALASAPHEPAPAHESPSELQAGATLLAPDRELASSAALPLSNVLAQQHVVDPTRPVPTAVQDQADDVSHVVAERAVHRGFGAEVQNVPRMGADVLRQLGHHAPDEAGGEDAERDAEGPDAAEHSDESDAGTRGGAGQEAVPPGPVPHGENWADGEEERAHAELAMRAAEAGDENDEFVLVDHQ